MKRLVFTLLIFASSANIILSQAFEMQMTADSISTLDFNFRKFFAEGVEQTALSGTYELRYQHIFNEKINGIIDVSYNSYSIDGFSESGWNNIFLGIQRKIKSSAMKSSAVGLGLYLPTSDEFTSGLGGLNNYYDLAKYTSNDIAIKLDYNSRKQYAGGFILAYELGTSILLGAESVDGDDIEMLGNAGLSLGYAIGDFYLQSELLSIFVLTDSGNFQDNSVHSYGFGLGYNNGKINPRIFYKDYIDEEIREFVDYFLGISFGINL